MSALDSVSAYVERADTLMILAPSSVHADMVDEHTGRKVYTCYRTWRRRGFCVLEFFCAHLSRRSTHPVLLVRSETDAPIWISPQECLKLAVGECNFTCCETNHLGHGEGSKMKCSRENVNTVLSRMIDAKSKHLFTTRENVVYGRLTRVLKHWWLRGLDEKGWVAPFCALSRKSMKEDLETWLDWDEEIDGIFFDRDGVSLLIYSVCANHVEAATCLIDDINRQFKNNEKERRIRIESRIAKNGFVHFGIPGYCTTLIAAMTLSTPVMVRLLLENGANPHAVDVNGNNSLICACVCNRVNTVRCWLKYFPEWNIDTRNKFGAYALTCAVMMGPRRFRLTKLLIESGASLNLKTHSGGTVLHSTCANEDCETDVLRFLLSFDTTKHYLGEKRKSQTFKRSLMNMFLKAMSRWGVKNSLISDLASRIGCTALHHAAMRGDLEIVELLLSAGANPSVKNDLGQDAVSMCKSFPELQGVLEKRERKMKLRGTNAVVEVLRKRLSTAIPIQHEMWLISLDMLLMLYVYLSAKGFKYSFSYFSLFLSLSLSIVA